MNKKEFESNNNAGSTDAASKKTASAHGPSGYFGKYGGRYVPEMLQGELQKLAET